MNLHWHFGVAVKSRGISGFRGIQKEFLGGMLGRYFRKSPLDFICVRVNNGSRTGLMTGYINYFEIRSEIKRWLYETVRSMASGMCWHIRLRKFETKLNLSVSRVAADKRVSERSLQRSASSLR